MKICFIIGSAHISGGTAVIFQHALHLKGQGYDVTIVPILDPHDPLHLNWHPATKILSFKSFAEASGIVFDLVIATWWRSVYELPRVCGHQYAYFVQSIETWFAPPGMIVLRNLIDATYPLALPIITEAKWIREYLECEYGHSAYLVPNGVSKDIYQLQGPVISPRRNGRLRLLVEGSLEADFKNVPRTIALARRSNADEIWLLTPSHVKSYPGIDRVFSRVSIEQTAEIYRSCDAIVKLSYVEGMFGPPLEMFCCGGTAIVYDVTGHDEYICHGKNAIVIRTDDEERVVQAIDRLKRDSAELARLKSGALRTAAQWPNWAAASPLFVSAVEEIVSLPPVDQQTLHYQIKQNMRHYLFTKKKQRLFSWMERAHLLASRLLGKMPCGERVRFIWLAYAKPYLRPKGGRKSSQTAD